MNFLQRTLLLAGLVMGSVSGQAETLAVCQFSAITAACEKSREDLTCLDYKLACGLESEVIAYHQTTLGYDARKAFYLGYSYENLGQRTRSASMRCDYLMAARSHYLSFLGLSNDQKSLNDERIFDHIYHASKSLKSLAKNTDCLNSSMTPDDVLNDSKNYTHEVLQELFLGGPVPDQVLLPVQTTRNNFQKAIQSMSNQASAIETQAGLRRVTMEANLGRLQKLASLFHKNFGTVSPDPDKAWGGDPQKLSLVVGVQEKFGLVKSRLAETGRLLSQVIKKISDLMGGISIEDYDSLRLTIVGASRDLVARGASFLSTSPHQFPQLQDLVQSIESSKTLSFSGSQIKKLHEDWTQKSKETNRCPSQSWYCSLPQR